jgi:broad specificity phosphatase PhoE
MPELVVDLIRHAESNMNVMGLALAPVIDGRLQELDQGDWTNQPRTLYDEPTNKQIMARLGSNFAPPNGESMNDVATRMEQFFATLVCLPHNGQPQHIWAYTHGVAIKSWAGRVCGWSHERTYKTPIHNVSMTRFVRDSTRWHLAFLNKQTF